MKKYKFRFESVLKSKKIIVDELASKNARALKILMLEERKLEDIRQRRAQCIRELTLLQTGVVNALEVQRCHRYLQLLSEALVEQESTIRKIAQRVEMLRGMLVEAEKERKIFEQLDEKDQERFFSEFLKKEQAALDEVGVNRFIQRSAHGRAHSSGE